MSSRGAYDNTGNAYNVSQIINADVSFNLTAYENYSPLFLPYVPIFTLSSHVDVHNTIGRPLRYPMDCRLPPSLRR